MPVWATLIALFDGDEPVVGLVSAPALNRRWWAAKDVGAGPADGWRTRPAAGSPTSPSSATRACPTPACPAGRSGLDGFLDLTRSVWRTRAYGDFWSYVLVAEGAVDVATEPEVSVWDLPPST